MQGIRRSPIVLAIGLSCVMAVLIAASCASASAAKKTFVFISGANNSIWFNPMQCGIQQEAHAMGASVQVEAPSQVGSIPQMIQLVDAAIAEKPNAIIIDPLDRTAFNATLSKAKADGIKVVFTDQSTSKPSEAVTSITSNNTLAGKEAGRELIKVVGSGGGDVLVLSGYAAQNSLTDRVNGFTSALKGHSNVTNLGVQYDQQSPTTAESIVSATLAAHPDLKGIFDTSSDSSQGVINALKRAGDIGKVKFVSYDTIPQVVQEVKSGEIAAAIGQSPQTMGVDAVKSAFKAFARKAVPKLQLVPTELVTKANANSPLIKSKYIYYTGGCKKS